MKALIDADIFTYSFGACKDDEGHPLAWPLVATRLNTQIKNICERVGADDYQLYLTGEGNFRISVATIRPYKGTRPSDKPFWYEQIRKYLINFRKAREVVGWEADDQLAMDQVEPTNISTEADLDYYENNKTVICSLDKDLDMVPGLHYNWSKDEIYTVTELDGLASFYCQLLTGDSVDNIPGLYGVGKSSAFLSRIKSYDNEWDMFNLVCIQYEKRFGEYYWQFLQENSKLLWMVRDEECVRKEMEITYRLKELRSQNIGQSWKNELLNSFKEIG